MTPDPTPPDDAGDDDGVVYLPDPEEIAAACRLFQMSWSDAERIKRRRSRPGRVAYAVGVEAAARTRLEFALSKRRGG